ncbi:SRPBCC family protein [Chryseobacterium gossypii]|uniref:SRPBCC family protein n=1 Tax=Chryseobacterium gossypii TaxID=3231602 RepID=UPI0035239D4C
MSTPIIVQYKVNAPVEKVWNALTDKDEMRSWYFDISDFEPEVGKTFNFYEPGEARRFHHRGKILEIIPNRKLKHTWSYPEFLNEESVVTWELGEDAGGTLVTLTHDDIENFNSLGENFSRDSFTEGWNGIIGQSLKPYLESN